MANQPSAKDHRKENLRRIAAVAVGIIASVTLLSVGSAVIAAEDDLDNSDTSTVTYNDFIPEERDLSDCISAIPKPGCGSSAKGGWRQMLVLGLVVTGLGFIGWRVVAGARKNLATQSSQAEGE
ncbi:MAG: hypothetical protein EBS76_11585 [Actinobacteria bacterium]|nr:hypothetical protein [Actinomycetota bacterium]